MDALTILEIHVYKIFLCYGLRHNSYHNKTLGRARDPRTNGAWLNKLTERNMKCLS